MNLSKQTGFVTIGPDDHDENVRVTEEAPTQATEASDEAAHAPDEGGTDGQIAAEQSNTSRTADGAILSSSTTLSRSGSIDGDLSEGEAFVPEMTEMEQSSAWAPHSNEKSINELHDYFKNFYSTRRIVKQTYHELKRACQGIQELLIGSSSNSASGLFELSATDRGTEAWLSHSEEQTIMSVLRTDPILLVLGGKGSGKSSVINGILGADILPSSAAMLKHPCNGIVHLKYDESGYVKIAKSTTERPLELEQIKGDLQQPAQMLRHRTSNQVREFIEEVMSDEERAAWGSLDNCVLEIGVKNPILRTRVQFLEIPGDCFDPKLRERLLRQLFGFNHQTVVYIIDGNKGLGNSDREFLFFLKASIPDIRIFFVINKVDYDPEAEEMDGDSDLEDSELSDSRFHDSGLQTQRRKQRLVVDQLAKYKLTGGSGRQTVYPVSVLRQRFPLDGDSEQISQLNKDYEAQYQAMVAALKDCLLETGRSRMELALSTLFLVSVRTFDAFTRDSGAEAEEGAQLAEQASKERILQSFRDTKTKLKECKSKFLQELTDIHKRSEKAIIDECRRLEFGPLRLYSRIRNNEVEQQYREQINNYVLHLLNVEIQESLERQINDLRTVLFNEVEKLKKMFSNASKDQPSSPWQDLIRTHADELVMNIVKLNFSVEWKSEAGFIKWVRKLWTAATVNKNKGVNPNTPEWKSEVAKEFYSSIDLNAVVRRMFAGVDYTLKQAEACLLNLSQSRHKFAAKLQKLLAKESPAARSVWLSVQFCLVSAEALRNVQAYGHLPSANLTEPIASTCLGQLFHLTSGYAKFERTQDSGIGVTVTQLCSSAGGGPDNSGIGSTLCLGGIPNHHLMKGNVVRNQRCVAITLMVTFNDKFELCVLHSAYNSSLQDFIEAEQGRAYTKLQGFKMIKDLLQIWKLFGQETATLPWSLTPKNLKTSHRPGASIVYDYLESPLPTLRKGHTFGGLLFTKSESEVRVQKQETELNNLLQVTLMILVRSPVQFEPDELDRIAEREHPQERHREFKAYIVSQISGLKHSRELDPIPADTIANLWHTAAERKVRDIEEWIERGIKKWQNC
uniref:Dynamin_N domain-containing protein n=1 Tax=Macrostomum lignano TaxID=282301 RepID=A0A1I8GKD9_9PLAT